MSHFIIGGERHGQGDGNAVVGAQSGLVRPQPITFKYMPDGISGKIMVRVRGFFTDHVHMALDDDAR